MSHFNSYNTEITDQEQEELERQQERRIKKAKYMISGFFALSGIAILVSQIWPLAKSYFYGKMLENQTQSIVDPITAQQMNQDNADLPYYDPGVSYFQNIIQHISPDYVAGVDSATNPQSDSKPIIIDKSYSRDMKLSIPSIGISNIIVTPNVDSFDEKIYNATLKRGLAHFLGTAVPGDGGNSFIYGHSTVQSWFDKHQDQPETIFTKLEHVEIADKVEIERDGKILEYIVQKKKIVAPDDFKVLTGINGKETITLMTCWPVGIGSQRLIIIAERTNG